MGGIEDSPFLCALREATCSDALSIKFNIDGYNMDWTSPDFTRGRIVGTIGPYLEGEPKHLIIGRHLMASGLPTGGFFQPAGGINFCSAVVDKSAGKIYLDLGNALPTKAPGGPMADMGRVSLCSLQPPSSPGQAPGITRLDEISYLEPAWYERTAGVAVVPEGRSLSSAELAAIADSPLALVLADEAKAQSVAIAEPWDGLYVRADKFVYRMSPASSADVELWATQWGEPYEAASVLAVFDVGGLQPVPGVDVGKPTSAAQFPSKVATDSSGRAALRIQSSDPGNPRGFIDGQVYGIRPILEDMLETGADYPFNPSDFISVLVWDPFVASDPPTWHGDLQPIFQQYANLYPVMAYFLDLADYDSVCGNALSLKLAFGLPMEDPNSMPVTRDLSPAKRAAILRWLSETGPDGKPLLGTPSAAVKTASAGTPIDGEAAVTRGGKSVAMDRRRAFRRRMLNDSLNA